MCAWRAGAFIVRNANAVSDCVCALLGCCAFGQEPSRRAYSEGKGSSSQGLSGALSFLCEPSTSLHKSQRRAKLGTEPSPRPGTRAGKAAPGIRSGAHCTLHSLNYNKLQNKPLIVVVGGHIPSGVGQNPTRTRQNLEPRSARFLNNN